MNSAVDTKKQILDIAENLLLDRGYNGFSYQHISSALGIRNASVHHHYPQKTDLGVAIIRRTRERFEKWTQSSKIVDSSFSERLAQFVSLFRHFLNNGGQVCLGGALETDFKTLPPEMQTETRAFIAAVREWVTWVLQEGRSRGEFRFPGDPDKQAIVTMSCLQGALQISRATDPYCFEAAVEQINQLIST
jgi:TetR/AcrR family transcriptional regulator, transcriptional repressor for nem operon